MKLGWPLLIGFWMGYYWRVFAMWYFDDKQIIKRRQRKILRLQKQITMLKKWNGDE